MQSRIVPRRKRERKGLFILLFVLIISLLGIIFMRQWTGNSSMIMPKNTKTFMSYHTNIISATQTNESFRRVLFTGTNSQLVVMSIPPGGEVGKETHTYTEQTLFFLSGTGEGELNGKQFPIIPGDVVVVVPGTEHNFWNTGTKPLKIYTVYAPPNHLPGLIEATKAQADANKADEAVGEKPPVK